MHDLLPLWLAAFPLMGSPGPATLSLAGIGSAFGVRQGLPYLAGIVLGTSGVLLMIAAGVTTLVLAVPGLVDVLVVLAGAYILYLAVKIATAPVGVRARATRAPAFVPGFLLAIANPKAFAAIGAVYSGRTVADTPLLDAAVKVAALVLVIVLVNAAWLAFGALFARLLAHPRLGRAVNILFAVMLVASLAAALF